MRGAIDISKIISFLITIVSVSMFLLKKSDKNDDKKNKNKNRKSQSNTNIRKIRNQSASNRFMGKINELEERYKKNRYLEDEEEEKFLPQIQSVFNSSNKNYNSWQKMKDKSGKKEKNKVNQKFKNENSEIKKQKNTIYSPITDARYEEIYKTENHSEEVFEFDARKAVIYSEILQKPLSIR